METASIINGTRYYVMAVTPTRLYSFTGIGSLEVCRISISFLNFRYFFYCCVDTNSIDEICSVCNSDNFIMHIFVVFSVWFCTSLKFVCSCLDVEIAISLTLNNLFLGCILFHDIPSLLYVKVWSDLISDHYTIVDCFFKLFTTNSAFHGTARRNT